MVYQDQNQGDRAWAAANDTRGGQPLRPPGDTRQINTRGLNIIMKFEPVSLEATRALNRHAIGFGHRDRKIKAGSTMSREDVYLLLFEDLEKIEKKLERWVKTDLSDNQYGALVSLIFDIGLKQFRKSDLRKHLNRGDFLAAAKEFESWIKVDGTLRRDKAWRRICEQDLFLCPDEETSAMLGVGRVVEQIEVKDLEVDALPTQYRKRRDSLIRQSRTIHGAGIAGASGITAVLASLPDVISFESIHWDFLKKGSSDQGIGLIMKGLDYLQTLGLGFAQGLSDLARSLTGSGYASDIVGGIILLCFIRIMWVRVSDHRSERR